VPSKTKPHVNWDIIVRVLISVECIYTVRQMTCCLCDFVKPGRPGTVDIQLTSRDDLYLLLIYNALFSGENKEDLVQFLLDCWKERDYGDTQDIYLFTTSKDECYKIHVEDGVSTITEVFMSLKYNVNCHAQTSATAL